MKGAAEELKLFCTQELGLKKDLMMVGNFARALFEERTVDTLCEKLIPPERVNPVKNYMKLFREMRSIYRATDATSASAERFREVSKQFKDLVNQEFPYTHPFSNYQHKVIDHVPDLIIEYGSVGKFSTEALEAGNKLCRRFRKCNA